MKRVIWLALLLLLVGVPGLGQASGADDIDEGMAERLVSGLLEDDPGEDLRKIWRIAEQLNEAGPPALPAIRTQLADAEGGRRLALGRALVLLEDYTRGLDALRDMAKSEAVASPLRSAAYEVIGAEGEPTDADWVAEAVDLELDPVVKMAMARALWRLNRPSKMKGKEVMLAFLGSTDPDLRALGALALGEIGAAAEARPVLRDLALEPTERGRSAGLLLRLLRAEQVIESFDRPSAPSEAAAPAIPSSPDPSAGAESQWPLLDEIWRHVSRAYAYPDKIASREAFEDAAASGLTAALDENTNYLSPHAYGEMLESLDPSYGGIGAYVFNDPDNGERFTISRPIYGGPIYRADIRAGDVVVMIGDTLTAGLDADACVKLLKGPPGTTVRVSIMRTGWTEAKEYVLTRSRIVIPTTAYDVLPGDIGFLQVQHFSEDTAREVGKILDEFAKRRVVGVVLDLRGNSGGYLRLAVEIASEFLPKGAPVVSEVGRAGVWPERRHVSDGRGSARADFPVIVLVNQGTASAAEILAGALKDNGRARIVGQMTFGKGTAQIPLPLSSREGEPFQDQLRPVRRFTDQNGNGAWDEGEPFTVVSVANSEYDPPERFDDYNGNGRYDAGESFTDTNGNGTWDDGEPFEDRDGDGKRDPGGTFKMTVARYMTPSGFNPRGDWKIVDGRIQRVGGIVPDVEARPREDFDFWEIHEQRKLESKPHVREFVRSLFAKNPDMLARLARSDRGDPASYPGFDDLYTSLETKLDPDAVRWLVRYHTRRVAGELVSRELVGDVVDDIQLQAALRDLTKAIGKPLEEIEDLAFLAQRKPRKPEPAPTEAVTEETPDDATEDAEDK